MDTQTVHSKMDLNNNPTTPNLESLAIQFKECSNGIDIFPKLPSMIKTYLKTWEKNNSIKTANNTMGFEVKALIRHLFSSQTDGNLIYPNITRNVALQSTDLNGMNSLHQHLNITTNNIHANSDDQEFVEMDSHTSDNGCYNEELVAKEYF